MKILSFGEVLWDVFENTRVIGGAPFNFSGHISKLGAQSYMLSSVGNDSLCEKTYEKIKGLHVSTEFVPVSQGYPTGVCNVVCDEQGQPTYRLMTDTAFDNVDLSDEDIERIKAHQFDAFYFGTLAQRGKVSRDSLNKILSNCTFNEIFCDLNLRPNCYNAESIANCLKYCTILKISREEYGEIIRCGFGTVQENDHKEPVEFYKAFSRELSDKYDIKIVIITLDKDGAFVYRKSDDSSHLSHKPVNKALSTVGAGDSFSAAFLYNYLDGAQLSECISRAVTLSDYVVTHYEAIPEYTGELYAKIR